MRSEKHSSNDTYNLSVSQQFESGSQTLDIPTFINEPKPVNPIPIKDMQHKLLETFKEKIIPGPLNGLVVLGFCYYVAGPVALQTLASQGALVFKIELPDGDPTRNVFSPNLFNSLSHSQVSIRINKKDPVDLETLGVLLKVANVIVDNRAPTAIQNDPFLQGHLKADKKDPQVYCSISGYPNNNDPGLDAAVQAATGLAATNGVGGNPLKIGVPVLDQMTGVYAATYILANLCYLRGEPLPQAPNHNVIEVNVSLAGIAVWLQAGQVLNAVEGKQEYFRHGNEDRFAVPFSYYETADGLISIATVNEPQFEKFCLHVLQDLEFHKKYPTFQDRIANQDQFTQDMNDRLKQKSREYWCILCNQHGVTAAPVLTVTEAVEQPYVKPLITESCDGRRIVTTGATNSHFPTTTLFKPAPAPKLNDGHKALSGAINASLPKSAFPVPMSKL